MVKRTALTVRPPKWIKPQLTRLAGDAPTGKDWLHEIKNDGYRMHARLDGDKDPIAHGLGLVASILAHHRTPALTQGEVCLLRWRALRAERGRCVGIQPAAGGNGRRPDRSTHILRLRSSLPERREHSSTAALKLKERLHRLIPKEIP